MCTAFLWCNVNVNCVTGLKGPTTDHIDNLKLSVANPHKIARKLALIFNGFDNGLCLTPRSEDYYCMQRFN